jgi:hypothetical protein
VARLVTWLGGALGLAALWRFLKREHEAQRQLPHAEPAPDPAAELRARLEAARETPDDRDEFDAAEGQPVDQVEPARPGAVDDGAASVEATEPAAQEPPSEPAQPTRSLDERRRAIHEKAQQALGEMQQPEQATGPETGRAVDEPGRDE